MAPSSAVKVFAVEDATASISSWLNTVIRVGVSVQAVGGTQESVHLGLGRRHDILRSRAQLYRVEELRPLEPGQGGVERHHDDVVLIVAHASSLAFEHADDLKGGGREPYLFPYWVLAREKLLHDGGPDHRHLLPRAIVLAVKKSPPESSQFLMSG
jgi:hypothetical protein